MSGLYGADVAQLRALAQQFDRDADRLEANRMTVGNAIQISAWIGPVAVRFRHQWDSDYSRRVHDASVRLRAAAGALRANADDQERTSAVSIGDRGAGTGASPGASDVSDRGFTAQQELDYTDLLDYLKLLNGVAGSAETVEAIRKLLDSGAIDIGTFTEWAGKLKKLDSGAVLGLVGMGITAHELGVAIGDDDPAATLEASLGLLFGAAGVAYPPVGAAWDIGYFLGESGYNSLQAVYDSPGGALDFAARQMYGPDATFSSIEQYQRDVIRSRYEGGTGVIASVVDSMGGAWDDFAKWISGGGGRGPQK